MIKGVNKSEMEAIFEETYPFEACAVLVGSLFYIIRNSSDNPGSNFLLNRIDLADTMDIGVIKEIIHSHVDSTNDPSPLDIISAKKSNIPWYIYSIIEGKIDGIRKEVLIT